MLRLIINYKHIKRKISFFFICFFVIRCILATNIYSPLVSEGSIPANFIDNPEVKFERRLKNIDEIDEKFERKESKRFFHDAEFLLDYIYRSGGVSFNNQLNKYINKIVDYLLTDHEELKDQLRFYIINDPDFNAFTVHDGTIFITIGLLAKIQSEAQLAFVLSHEISHFVNDHNVQAYIELQKIKNEKKESYKNLNYDNKLVKISEYSKQQEIYADSDGFKRFYLATEYKIQAIQDLFDHTLIADYPLGDNNSIYNLFQIKDFQFPDEYKLEHIDTFSAIENYNDSLSTHPNLKKRKENISSLLSNENPLDGEEFIISKVEFNEMQKIARFELTHLYLASQKYEEAICNSHYLLSLYPNNLYAEISIGVALMQLAHYKAKDDFFYIHKDYKKVQGSSQHLFYFIEQLNDNELGVLALIYNWILKQKYPENEYINKIVDNTFKIMVMDLKMNANDFNTTYNKNSEYYYNALISFIKNNSFHDYFTKYEELEKKIQSEKLDLIENKEKRKLIAKQKKYIQKHGFALGIDTLVIVNPTCVNFYQSDIDKSSELRYSLIESSLEVSEKIDLHTTVLDVKCMKNNEIDKFNDYCIISNWFNEKCNHYSDEYFIYNEIYTDYLIKKYNTKYFAWTGLIQVIENKVFNSESGTIAFYLFNIETGEILLSQREWINAHNSKSRVRSGLKKILQQVKNKQKI